jgi:E3 ubiquitin-protein ligase SHPRH
MRDLNWQNTMEERKKKVRPRLGVARSARADQRRRQRQINALIRCAQLIQHAEDDSSRHQAALDALLQAKKDASALVDDVKAAMAQHDAKGKVLKREAAANGEARGRALPRDADEEVEMDTSSGRGKDKDKNATPDAELDGSVYDDLPKTPAGEAHAAKRRGLVARLRECRLTLHRVKLTSTTFLAKHTPLRRTPPTAPRKICGGIY